MNKKLLALGMGLGLSAAHAESYSLYFSCKGDNASMEVYLPSSLADSNTAIQQLGDTRVQGYYALDLTPYGKGKPLEPVLIGLNAAKTMIILDQYTRGLPPTAIPVAGGGDTLNFDNRFGTNAVCTRVN